MQSVSSRIWTRVAVSISYDDNHYTTGTSFYTTGLLHAIDVLGGVIADSMENRMVEPSSNLN